MLIPSEEEPRWQMFVTASFRAQQEEEGQPLLPRRLLGHLLRLRVPRFKATVSFVAFVVLTVPGWAFFGNRAAQLFEAPRESRKHITEGLERQGGFGSASNPVSSFFWQNRVRNRIPWPSEDSHLILSSRHLPTGQGPAGEQTSGARVCSPASPWPVTCTRK